MKSFLRFLSCLAPLACCPLSAQTPKKFSEFVLDSDAVSALTGTDLVLVIHDPSGTPTPQKATITNFGSYIASATLTLTNKTYNGLAVTTTSGGTLTIANSVTLTASNNITLATDGTGTRTLNIGAGGTLGSAAFTAASAYLAVTNNLSDLANAATARANLGLAIGTDVQAYNASLAAIAGGTWTGASSITSLGTVASGTWQATPIGLSYIAQGGASSGQVLAWNGTAWAPAASSAGLTIGTTTITDGTSGRVLYDAAGVVGEMTTTGSGTVLVLSTGPSISGAGTSITNVGTFALRDTSAAYDVTIGATSSTALTAGRTITLDVGNTSQTLKFTGSSTITFPSGTQTLAKLGANAFVGTQTIAPTTPGTAISITSGAITSSLPIIDATQQWNSSGVTFYGVRYAFAQTGSADGSRYFAINGMASGTQEVFAVRYRSAGYTELVLGQDGYRTLLKGAGGSIFVSRYDSDTTHYFVAGYDGVAQGVGVGASGTVSWNSSAAAALRGEFWLLRRAANTLNLQSRTAGTAAVLEIGGDGSTDTKRLSLTHDGTNGLISANSGVVKISGLTITASTGTLTVTDGKTLSASNTLTLAGTDGSTLNVGSGGTLGTAAYLALDTDGALAANSDSAIPSQKAVKTYADTKAPLESPSLTGVPVAPTATPGTNTTQLATTAFVQAAQPVILTGAAALDFGAVAAGGHADLFITVTGAAVGDVVAVGIPNNVMDPANHPGGVFEGTITAWVSGADTVTVRWHNLDQANSDDPPGGTFTVKVFK